MATRMTIEQLKKLKTHELADMLTNVVLVLQCMPDVECGQLMERVPVTSSYGGRTEAEPIPATSFLTHEELMKKTVSELKTLAKDLNVFFSSSIRKSDLVQKILARPSNGKSEQRAIRDM